MRKLLLLSGVLGLAACNGNPSVSPKVSWGYGAGNGDPVTYNGPAPKYSFGNGLSQDMPVDSGQMPKISYGYGADETKGVSEQMGPAPQQQVASPASAPQHPALAPAPNSHL